MATALLIRRAGVLRHSAWDAVLVFLSLAQAAALLTAPSLTLIAIGTWWNANTVAHNFIHRPFFRSRRLNQFYSIYLSVLLGIPQSLWRRRHLRHHAGTACRRSAHPARSWELGVEVVAVLLLWTTLALTSPRFFATVYLPGYGLALVLCALHGHFEHARGTTSHYGRLYNALFFNDGYHVEHHERPGEHWTRLPQRARRDHASRSRWPPVLRWIDAASLESLERVVLRSRLLQRFVLSAHERAFRGLLHTLPPIARVTIVGGGLFPRTALILRALLPAADVTIVDANATNLVTARTFLDDAVHFVHARYDPDVEQADLVVIPLAYVGDRRRACRPPAAGAVIVHDWIWTRGHPGVTVSWWLLKRLSLARA